MLAANGVEENVLNIGEGRNEEPGALSGRAVERCGVQVQTGGSGLGQPDRMSLLGRQLRINESRRGPRPRRRRGEPASG